MIQTIVTHPCPKCGSENMVRNGHDYKGAQKFYCKTCESYGTLHAQRSYDDPTRNQVERAVLERLSLRGIERLFGISRCTIAEWIEHWVAHLPPLETTLVEAQLDDVLE
jgi:insertion element IS1 protein InsB